jgi:hypothetical protein
MSNFVGSNQADEKSGALSSCLPTFLFVCLTRARAASTPPPRAATASAPAPRRCHARVPPPSATAGLGPMWPRRCPRRPPPPPRPCATAAAPVAPARESTALWYGSAILFSTAVCFLAYAERFAIFAYIEILTRYFGNVSASVFFLSPRVLHFAGRAHPPGMPAPSLSC